MFFLFFYFFVEFLYSFTTCRLLLCLFINFHLYSCFFTFLGYIYMINNPSSKLSFNVIVIKHLLVESMYIWNVSKLIQSAYYQPVTNFSVVVPSPNFIQCIFFNNGTIWYNDVIMLYFYPGTVVNTFIVLFKKISFQTTYISAQPCAFFF